MSRRPLRWLLVLALAAALSPWVMPSTAQPLVRLTRQQVEAVLRLSKNLALRDLSGLDLTGLYFHGANLREANLTGANLEGVTLDAANLRHAKLVRVNLRGAQLAGADLTEADLTDANLERVTAARSNWTGAILRGVQLVGADLEQADMLGTNLERANLQGVRLTESKLIRARFPGAILVGANFDRATLTFTSFVGADLTRASLRFARLNGADFAGANIDGTNFAKAEASEALNLDAAKNAASAVWEDRPSAAVTPGSQVTRGGAVTARIFLRNGDPIEVETLDEQAEVFLYGKGGAAYGIPKANVRRIEDAQGRVLREFVEKPPSPSGQARIGADCSRPKIEDHVSYMTNYLKCMDKHKVRVSFSQGISAKAAGEQTGQVAAPAASGLLLRRWELRDEQGRVIEVYEALGNDREGKITLVSE